ncbi:MAG TPA: sulfatase [Planctomycetaceae bacterium]|nr:sulfatase [Planctomycetaceae bacterium]
MNADLLTRLQRRRRFLGGCTYGIGAIALANLINTDTPVKASEQQLPHHLPRARRVIFLNMSGGPSQLDLFDPKPQLQKWHGRRVPDSFLEGLADPVIKGGATLMATPRQFTRHGKSGMEFSDRLPHLSRLADDVCMFRAMVTDTANHHPGQLLLNCGSPMFGHPSMGSWVNYGLGSESQNMPGFVVLMSYSKPASLVGPSLWSNGFLPSSYRGVAFRSQGDPILHLTNPQGVSARFQRAKLDTLRRLNSLKFEETRDREITARIDAYELAYRMQAEAPELLDFSDESASTLQSYGLHQDATRWYGTNCLLARRMIERGVRFVELFHSDWDHHLELDKLLKVECAMTDQPAAALLTDLKQRGLLDDTLVIWGGEFGRTPMNEVRRGNSPGHQGRDHHPYSFALLMAGGGIRGGQVIGQTDELGYHGVEEQTHVHDIQATILHCLGLDHTRLTYRHQGRDFRLTDVGGTVVRKALA